MAQTPAPPNGAASHSPVPTPGAHRRLQRSRIPSLSPRSVVDNPVSPQLESAESLCTPSSTPRDKPLPARPVASFVNGPSPTKDGRGLIDACEKPLTEWPALTPRSASAPKRISTNPSPSPKTTPHLIPRKSVRPTATSTIAAESPGTFKNRETRDSKLSTVKRQSSTSSFDSAAEDGQSYTKATDASAPPLVAEDDEDGTDAQLSGVVPDPNTPSYPTRDPPTPPTGNDTHRNDPIVSNCEGDLQKTSDNHPAASTLPTAPHSSNFSWLRSGSNLQTGEGAQVLTPAGRFGRHHRTVSRIPIPGARKANVINISAPPASGKELRQSGVSPSFGSRRIVSPNAMRVLDEGMKRRRHKGGDSVARTASAASSTLFFASKESISSLTRAASSPEHTAGSSCSDNDEALTPATSANPLRQASQVQEASDRSAWSEEESPACRPPPSCSPYMGPLPTIPSQSVLPTHIDTMHEKPISADLAELVQQYSDFDTASDSEEVFQPFYSSQDFDVANNASFAETYESSEEKTSSSSSDGDPHKRAIKTEKHRGQTLSQLEGVGTPPTPAPELAAVSEYFRNKISLEDQQMIQDTRKPAKESTLAEKIVANHKCLKRLEGNIGNANPARHVTDVAQAALSEDVLEQSIGFPSSNARVNPEPASNAQHSIVPARSAVRGDSPTLCDGLDIPRRIPGSVTAARQGITNRCKSYTDQTLATETKRIEKSREPSGLPVPINSSQRGRSRNPDNQESRPRSRSRKYLDKKLGDLKGYLPALPGLPRRRDKNTIPPVPAIPSNAHAVSSKIRSQYAATTGPSPSSPANDLVLSDAVPKCKSPTPRKSLEPSARLAGIARTSATETPTANDDDMSSDEAITFAQMLEERAKEEKDKQRSLRLLEAAQALINCMGHAAEAKINAEKAQQAANEASQWAERTQHIAHVLQRAARTITQESAHLQQQQ